MPLEKEKREFSDLFHNSSYGGPCSGRDQRGVDWHKLASLEMSELAIPCVDSGALVQDHLSYITTCDAASELDLSKAADRRSLLKLFRISQHLLRHLIGNQRQQLDDLSKTKEQLAIYMEKYTQSKTKLLQQIAEAKKMKENNRNLRDTVKFINSVAISKGIVTPVKCDYCPKIFREGEYLRSHIERKHMTKYNRGRQRISPRTIVTSSSVNHNNIELVEVDNTLEDCANGNIRDSRDLDKVWLDTHDETLNSSRSVTLIQQQAENTKREEVITVDDQNETLIGTNERFRENHQHRVVHEKKMHELEEKCTGLYEDFAAAIKKFQEEKQDWNKQIVESRNEAEAMRKQKIELESHFRIQLDVMNKKLRELEGRTKTAETVTVHIDKQSADAPATELALIKRGRREDDELPVDTNNHSKTKSQVEIDDVSQLQAKLIAQKLTNSDLIDDSDESTLERKFETGEACLSSITEVSAENDENNGQEDSIYDINSLPSDNEARDGHQVGTEKLDIRSRNQDVRRNSSGSNIPQDALRKIVDHSKLIKAPSVQKRMLPPSPKARSVIPPKAGKRLPKPKDDNFGKSKFKDDDLQGRMGEISNASESPSKYVDSKKSSIDITKTDKCNANSHKSKHIKDVMYESATDSGSEGTMKNSTMNEKIHSDSKHSSDESEDFDSEVDDDNEAPSIEDNNSQSLKKLDDMLEENPHLWKQLRQAADEVINAKLSSMEIDPKGELNKATYKKAIRQLRSDRKHLEKKHSNFNKLRKRIHHQLKSMIKKKEQALKISDVNSRKTFSVFKRAGQSVKTKINKKSDYLRKFRKVSSAAPTDITSSPEPVGRVVVCSNTDVSAEQREKADTETPEGSIHESYSSENEDDPSELLDEKIVEDAGNQPPSKQEFETVIDIHNETRHTVRRKLFGESSEASASQPKDDNSISTIQPDDNQENEIDNTTIESDSPRGSDETLEEVEVNEQDESDEEEVQRPPTRVGSFFLARTTTPDNKSDTSSHHYESQDKYEEQAYRNIKLKQPTGKNILKLKANIESQLMQRQKGKPPAGAVDIAPHEGGKTAEGSAAAATTSQETRVVGFWDDSTEDEIM